MKRRQQSGICNKSFTVHIVLVNNEKNGLKADTYHVHFLRKCSIHYWEKKINNELCSYT